MPLALVVTTFGRPGYLRRALDAGASGFVVKDTPARELAEEAVRQVHAGLRVVDPALATEELVGGQAHSPSGETSSARRSTAPVAIASRMHLSPGTVRNYLSAAIGKTATSTRVEAAQVAQQRGWL